MSIPLSDAIETIAEEPTEAKKWAASVNEALGGAGIKEKPKNPQNEVKMKAWEDSIHRRQHIVDALEIFHDNGGFDLIGHEIEIQQEFRGSVTELDIGRIVRGHLFENLALHLLAQEGKPINPEASQKIANIVRFPHNFIDMVEDTFRSKGIPIDGEIAQSLASARSRIKKHPRNNDAIAFDIDEVDGVRTARITGSYEMKNYMLGDASKAESVRRQLEDAAEDTREVITILNETKLYTAYTKLVDAPELPHVVTIVEEEEFQQTVVQPQGMFQTDLKTSAEQKKAKYEQDFNKGTRKSNYGFSYVGISNKELQIIYEKAERDVKKYLENKKPKK